MGVITDKKNKPFNPRGNDQSPLAFNKAAIYSGKALDFDGVNDVVTTTYTSGFTGAQEFTYCAYINTDNTAPTQAIVHGNETVGWGLQSLWIENNKILFYAGTGSASTSQVASETLEPNKWYFIVGTHTPTENKIYLNGVLNGTATAANLTAAPQAIKVGAYANASLPFNGEITNVKVFNTALTPAQVADLYNFPEKIVPTGVANTALKLWLPMQEGAGTTAYDGIPVGFTEDIVTGFTNGTTYPLDSFVSSGDDITTAIKTSGFGGCVSNGHTYYNGQKVKVKFTYQKNSGDDLRVLFSSFVTGAGTAISNIQNVSASGEFEHTFTMTADGVAYLQLGTGNAGHSINAVITDVYVSPNVSANHGTISGATYVHGIGAPVAQTAVIDWNKLYDFDGSDLASVGTYLDTTGTKTYKVHFNSHDVTRADQQIFQFWNNTDAIGVSGTINFSGSNSGVLGIRGYSSASFDKTSWSGLTNNTFYELEFTVNWDTESISSATLNGAASDGTQSSRLNTSNNGLYLGAGIGAFHLVGIINYFEVVGDDKWTNASGFKSESGSYDMTITGSPTQILAPQGLTADRDITGVNLFENVRKQGALNLDGNSWAEVHDNESIDFGTGSFTLEAWARAKYVSQGSAVNAIFTLGGDSASNEAIYINSSPAIKFEYNGDTTGTGTETEGDWVHIVGTYDETNATLYINGSQNAQNTRTAADITNTLVKQIGRDSTTFRYYNDQIAQPRIYNRALTAEEIQRNYDAGKNTYTN